MHSHPDQRDIRACGRRAATLLLVVALLTGCISSFDDGVRSHGRTAASGEPVASLAVIEDETDVSVDRQVFARAEDGQHVGSGDRIRTNETGFAEITYHDGSWQRVDTGATVEIIDLLDHPGPVIRIRVDVGRSWNHVRRLSEPDRVYELETPVATASVRGTTFATSCTSERCEFTVIEGTVEVSPRIGDPVTLDRPSRLSVATRGVESDPVPLDDHAMRSDPWITRNLEMDAGQAPTGDPDEDEPRGPISVARSDTNEEASPSDVHSVHVTDDAVWWSSPAFGTDESSGDDSHHFFVFDRTSATTTAIPLPPGVTESAVYTWTPSASGDRLALGLGETHGWGFWVYEVATGAWSHAFDPEAGFGIAVWSASGQTLFYTSPATPCRAQGPRAAGPIPGRIGYLFDATTGVGGPLDEFGSETCGTSQGLRFTTVLMPNDDYIYAIGRPSSANWTLYRIHTDGRIDPVTELPESTNLLHGATRDGQTLLATNNPGDHVPQPSETVVIDIARGRFERIGNAGELHPSIGPDGAIVFSHMASRASRFPPCRDGSAGYHWYVLRNGDIACIDWPGEKQQEIARARITPDGEAILVIGAEPAAMYLIPIEEVLTQ